MSRLTRRWITTASRWCPTSDARRTGEPARRYWPTTRLGFWGRETATDFDIPMFFVQGAHEADGRADVFADWYPMVDAPIKDLIVLDTSGHRPLLEQPDEFVDSKTDTVLARTAGTD